MVDMVPISSVVSDYDKLRMTSEGHNIGEQSEREEAEAAAAPPASEADDMEDGEICEDEEEDTKPSPSCNTAGPSASSGARSSSSKDSGSSRSSTRSSHGGPQSALSSWSGTVSARQGAGRSPGGDSSLFDPNEEYYRSSGHEERDRDYRYLDDNPSVIQDFSTDTDHRSPTSPSRYDSKRRRRSVSPDEYRHAPKRARASSPPYHRSSRRAPLGRGRWNERQICKFFREGYCRDGDNCNYSHDASDSMRKPELCKFYQHGYCKKGLQCPLLHGEFPCKAFHKGECSKEQCQYSHVALNEFTQTIFDQMMKDEELASKIMVPAAPVKRKVLLPSGPHEPPRPTPAPASEPMEYVPTPHLPPIADPSMSALLPLQPMPAMPVPETMGAPLDHHAPRPHVEATPAPVVPEMMHVPMQPDVPQPMQMPAEVPRQPEIAPSQAPPAVQEAGDNGPAGFNINDMLAQITQATPVVEDYSAYAPLEEDAYMAPRELNDSPASPSREEHPEPLRVESPLSPTKPVVVPAWRLLPVEVNTEENAIFEEKILQMSQSNSTLRMDPRLRKLLDNQFDRVSSLIGSMAQKTNAPVEEPKSQIQHPPPIATHTAAAAPAPARPDPRVRADPRDPRKRSAADPRDPRLRSDTATPADSAAPSSSSASELRVIYNAADEHALVHGYVDDPAWGTDVDHRPNFNQYGNSPPYHGHDRQYNGSSYNDNYNGPSSYRSSYRGERGDRGERSERGERYRGRGRGHWNRDRPPRESRYHGSRYDYDDEDPRSRRNGSSHTSSSSLAPPAESAVPAAPEQPVAPPQPMSLREKRKDNIYESPLSRPPGGATRY